MESKVEYFIERTDRKLSEIDKKIEALLAFKFMLLGGSALVSLLVSLTVAYFESRH